MLTNYIFKVIKTNLSLFGNKLFQKMNLTLFWVTDIENENKIGMIYHRCGMYIIDINIKF